MFDVGDLVWAKMRGFSFWPSEIADPSAPNAPSKPVTQKKPQHLVFFFGTENYAWITDDCIVPHSEEMLEACCNKKKSSSMQKAIDHIIDESKSRPSIQNREYEEISKEPLEFIANARKQLLKACTTVEGSLRARYSAKAQTASSNKYLADIRKKARKHNVTKKTKNALPPKRVPKRVHSKIRSHGIALIKPLPNEPPPAMPAQCINCTDDSIGFLGLGTIGQMLVKNLINFGHDVTVWNRTPEKCAQFVKAGAQQAQTPADVIQNCDITFCCVSGPDAVKEIMFSKDGVISGLEKCCGLDKGYVEMTSIDPVTSEEIAEAILGRGGRYLEAIASGSKEFADSGSLLILSAGDHALFNSCESCLFTMAAKVYFLGSVVGNGCKMNLIVSSFMGIMHAAVAESMALIKEFELSQNHFLEFLGLGPFVNGSFLLSAGNAIATDNYSPRVKIRHQQRDLSLTLLMSEKCQQAMPLITQANQHFQRAKALGNNDQDVAAVYYSAYVER